MTFNQQVSIPFNKIKNKKVSSINFKSHITCEPFLSHQLNLTLPIVFNEPSVFNAPKNMPAIFYSDNN